MSQLDEILDQGSDREDGITYRYQHKEQIKILMLEIYVKALKGETLTDMGEIFRKEVKAL